PPPANTTPNPASGLTASAISQNEIDLSWADNSDNENGFKVQRRPVGGSYQTIFTTGQNVTSYQDFTATPGTQYFYQIVATNDSGDAQPSNEFGVATPSNPTVHTFTSADVGNPTP